MRVSLSSLVLLTAGALAAPMAAQKPLFGSDQVAGWVPGTPGEVIVQQPPPNCTRTYRCANVLGAAANAVAGGTAYDPRHQAVWVSDGNTLELRGLRSCNSPCSRSVHRAVPGSVVSGLAMQDRGSRLWQLETRPGAIGLVAYDVSGAPTRCATKVNECTAQLNLPGTALGVGLAFDEPRQLLYVLLRSQTAPNVFIHYLLVVRPQNPCARVCLQPIRHLCMTRGAQGMAYDGIDRQLYVTDERSVVAFNVIDPLQCRVTPGQCCRAQGRFRGLAHIAAWRLRSHGTTCIATTCTSCPTLRAETSGGDAAIGNPDFKLSLVDAQENKPAVLLVKTGPAAPGVPLFCGQLFAYPVTVSFGHTTGAGSCTAQAHQPLPLPLRPILAGKELTFQWGVLCSTAPAGIAITNAVEFRIAGN